MTSAPAASSEAAAPAAASSPSNLKRAAQEEADCNRVAKQQRIEEPSTPEERSLALKQQIEYYLSDRNLRRDKFFHAKISSDPDGWLPLSLILGCRKIQALQATEEEILAALQSSSLETRKEPVSAVRRTEPLPELQSEEKSGAKSNKKPMRSAPRRPDEIHCMGVLLQATGLPEEVVWSALKSTMDTALQKKGAPSVMFRGHEVSRVRYASNVTAAGSCYMYLRKFDDDLRISAEVKEIELNGQRIMVTLVTDVEVAKHVFETLPENLKNDRERDYAEWKRKLQSRPITVGGKEFQSVSHLRKCCKEVLDATKEGEQLGENAFPVISAVMDYHPRASEKKQGMVAITVGDRTEHGTTTKCYFLIRADGTRDDISLVKCFEAMSRNPPFTDQQQPPQEANEEQQSSAPGSSASKKDAESAVDDDGARAADATAAAAAAATTGGQAAGEQQPEEAASETDA